MAYSTTRTIMINFAGSVTNLTASTHQAFSLIDRLGQTAVNIGKSFTSALGGNFKPLLKTVVGGITAFAKVLFILPSFLLALVNPMSVVNMAFTGFSQALTTTSPAEYVGATRNMAPAMKDAVAAIRLLEPRLKNLYGIVEQGFWAGFSTDIDRLAAVYFPVLDTGLGSLATTLGGLREDLVNFLLQPQVVATIQQWIASFGQWMQSLLPLVEQMLPTMISLFKSLATIMMDLLPIVTVLAGWFATILNFVAPILSGISGIVTGTTTAIGGAGGSSGGGSGGGSSGGGSSGGIGGFFSGLWHGITGFFSGLFGGGRAAGGPVFAGHSYLVGERGPEMLRMGSGMGNITPNISTGHTFVTVKIGESELRDMISHEIRRSDQATATMARMGRGLIT